MTGQDRLLVFYWCKTLALLETRCEAGAGKCHRLTGLANNVISDTFVPGNVKLTFCKGTVLREVLLV